MSNEIRFPGDEAVLGYLATHTEEHFKRQRALGARPGVPPNRAQFDALLRACFAASLEQEEGRRVDFTLFYDAEAIYADYVFATRQPLSPPVLARLSAALDASRSYLCVGPDAGALSIVGIRHWGDHSSFAASGGHPSHVVIQVAGPGILAVRYDMSVLLTYRRGEVAFYPEQFSAHNDAMADLLPAAATSDAAHLAKLRESIAHIAETMLQLRHGGTLLLVPDATSWRSHATAARFSAQQPAVRVQHALISASVGQRVAAPAIDERARRLGQAEFASPDLDVQLGVELEWLAQLTATDGITVVTNELTLLGFGVFFRSSDANTPARVKDPYCHSEATGELLTIGSLGGARHQSAAAACGAIPGSTALVVSQDGTLSVMRLEPEGELVVHKHLELLLRT